MSKLSKILVKLESKKKLQVFLLIIGLLLLTYWSYYARFTVVNGDTNAHYLSDAYYWWNNGGIFSPPQWIPYAWMGRPGGTNIQDSSYVLPVGVANLIHYWSPTVSAVLESIYTALGAWGMYLLVRRMGYKHSVALIALTAQFFFPAVFSNAQFLDFHRGASLLPWLLMVMSPLWYWEKRWGIPLATLIYWQIFVSTYPGQLIGAAFCTVLWTLGWAFIIPTRRWLLRSVGTGIVGVLLALIKFLPALLQGTGDRVWEEQRVVIDPQLIATFFFPYNNPAMSSDIAVRPFFLVLPVLFAVIFARFKDRKMIPVYALAFSSIVLLGATVFSPRLLERLPGMNLSRFWVNDFKNFLLAGIILLGVNGINEIYKRNFNKRKLIFGLIFSTIIILFFALFLDQYSKKIENVGFVIPFLIIIGLGISLWHYLKSNNLRRIVAGVSILSIFSGLFFAYSVTSTWASPKIKVENSHYGTSIAQLVAEGKNSQSCENQTGIQREGRLIPSSNVKDWWHDTVALKGSFDCSMSIGGYTNVPGSPVLTEQAETFNGENGKTYINFFSAPGAIVPTLDNGEPVIEEKCLISGECGNISVAPVEYKDSGHFVYEVEASENLTAVANESFYEGWKAEICEEKSCRSTPVTAGKANALSINLPEGSYTLKLTYEQPYYLQIQIAFWLLIAILLLSIIIPEMKAPSLQRMKENEDRTQIP